MIKPSSFKTRAVNLFILRISSRRLPKHQAKSGSKASQTTQSKSKSRLSEARKVGTVAQIEVSSEAKLSLQTICSHASNSERFRWGMGKIKQMCGNRKMFGCRKIRARSASKVFRLVKAREQVPCARGARVMGAKECKHRLANCCPMASHHTHGALTPPNVSEVAIYIPKLLHLNQKAPITI